MKRFLIFLMVCSMGSAFAQTEEAEYMPDFQFRYLTNGQLYSFVVTGFSDLETLNKDAYMSFVGGQKSADLAAIYGVSTYCSDSKKEPYYSIYEYDTLGGSAIINHLYKSDGAWLYTIREIRVKTDLEEKAIANILKTYITGKTTEEPMLYVIDRGTGENGYMIDIYSDLKHKYEPKSTEVKEYEEVALRLIVDYNYQVVQEFNLIGSPTELRELQLMSPVFLK